MDIFIIMAMTTTISFMFYKLFLVIICKILRCIFKVEESNNQFDLGISIAMQVIFTTLWIMVMDVASQKYELSNLLFYISFCLIGAFCIIWCYFSWDAEHIFVKPCVASPEHRRIKKVVIYILICVFVLCQGYHQTLQVMDSSYEVNILFSVTNYSVIVAAIALDRVMNQMLTK